MADVRPLRGIRFNPVRSGPVGPLIAPPYDVAPEAGAAAEFSIRNIEGIDLAGDGNDHALAAHRYQQWLDAGILVRDEAPAMYAHRHQFVSDGAPVVRTGILARVRLTDWSDRVVLPHERTTPGPRHERLQRLRAVGANLSPLYFLYRDPDGAIRNLIARHAGGRLAPDGRDHMGGLHDLHPIADSAFHERFAGAFADRALFVADGHHRYEAALAYRNECRTQTGADEDAPSEFILALLVAAEDSGVVVRPTHRLLVGTERVSAESMLAALRQWFDIRPAAATSSMSGDELIARLVLPGSHGTWDLHALPGRPHHGLVPRDRGPAWRALGVAAVQGILENVLGLRWPEAESGVIPVVNEADALGHVASGAAQAAILLATPSLNRLLAVAEEGDLLPPKSTWFDPKAPAGLVINDLRI